jgi:glyoxylase-like metal-dependent hydrolase (beta-lactamase superfamily II)
MSEAQLRAVAEGVYAWVGAGGDSNAGAVVTAHGLIVIDAQQNRTLGEQLRDALERSIGIPICAVVNTHYHLDHVAGNVAFDGVPIIAHEKTLQALERELGPMPAEGVTVADALTKVRLFFGANFAELVPEPERAWFLERVGGSTPMVIRPPTEVFADRLEFRLPGDTLRMEYWGPAHCDGDIVISLAKSGVVFLADLFFHGRFPWFGDCDLDGWIAALERVLAMDVRTVIPGHGPPTSLKEVAQFRNLLAAVRDAASRALRAGWSEDAAVREIVLANYAAMPRYREWMPFNIRSAFRYLAGRKQNT